MYVIPWVRRERPWPGSAFEDSSGGAAALEIVPENPRFVTFMIGYLPDKADQERIYKADS